MSLVSADENLFEAAAVCHIMCFGESRIQWMFRRRPCAGVLLADDDETCTISQKDCGLLGQSCRFCNLWLSERFWIFKCQNPILATQQKCRFFFTQNLALCMNKKLTGRLVEIFEFQMGIHILSELKSTTTLSMTCLRFLILQCRVWGFYNFTYQFHIYSIGCVGGFDTVISIWCILVCEHKNLVCLCQP